MLGRALGRDHQRAIYCHPTCGPTYGVGIPPTHGRLQHPHDISVKDGANGNANSYTNPGRTYQLPSGQSARTFFPGKNNFKAAEVEVYQVRMQ